jgi:anthranilate phosphoribosyltransferase
MKQVLEQLLCGEDLSDADAAHLLVSLTRHDTSPAMAGALLAALRTKGETPDEIRGFALAMRDLARRPNIPVGVPAIDIVGTGGDGSCSLNLSTGSALVTAACGLPVIKHGNRSVSSKSGSADVLEALGLELPLDENTAGCCFERSGFTFLFAPYYHPAMKALASVRQSLGVRTALNVLGPLTNPAEPAFYLVGAFSTQVAEVLAGALACLDAERAFVVHGAAGWDEATPIGPFTLFDVLPGDVKRTVRDPAQYGIPRCSPEDLIGGDATENAKRLLRTIEGEPGPHRDALALGAALALETAGRVANMSDGLDIAFQAIDSGRVIELLERIVEPALVTQVVEVESDV